MTKEGRIYFSTAIFFYFSILFRYSLAGRYYLCDQEGRSLCNGVKDRVEDQGKSCGLVDSVRMGNNCAIKSEKEIQAGNGSLTGQDVPVGAILV